jgi:hypothetical protein
VNPARNQEQEQNNHEGTDSPWDQADWRHVR